MKHVAPLRSTEGGGLGDIVTKVQLGWQHGEFSQTIYVQTVAPTGRYETGFAPIIGLHRPGIDTGWAFTWANKATSLQLNGALGVTFNFENTATDPQPNLLAIRIQPDEGILLRFGSKVPGLGLDIRTVNMDFTYGSSFSTDSPDAYETLVLDAMLGDASLFTRADEVEAAWGIATPVLESWIGGAAPAFPNYPAGTWGPAEADDLLERDGRRWRRI